MVDTHTHIYDSRFDADRGECLERAASAGIDFFVVPATMDDEHEMMLKVCLTDPRFLPTMGLHPLAGNDNAHWREHLKRVEDYLEKQPDLFVAIGETGLDMHWSQDFLAEQTAIFERQIELSIRYDLPLIIHTREAWDEILPIMERYAGQIRGVFHSFSGEREHVERIEKMGGFMYGINGTITYKKSTLSQVLIQNNVSLDKILVETDSPYLPPEPHRGKRNEPSYVKLVAVKLASTYGVSLDEIDNKTTKNAIEMFKVSPFLNVKNNI